MSHAQLPAKHHRRLKPQIPASTTPFRLRPQVPTSTRELPITTGSRSTALSMPARPNYNCASSGGEPQQCLTGCTSARTTRWRKTLPTIKAILPTAYAGEVNYGIPIANRFDVHSDYGNVEGTRRNRFLLTGLYQLPVGEGRTFLNTGGWGTQYWGGWELTTITLLETALGLRQASATPSISPIRTSSTRRRFLASDQVSSNFYQGQSRGQYFNLAAFAPTPAGAGRSATPELVSCRAPAQSRPASASPKSSASQRQ